MVLVGECHPWMGVKPQSDCLGVLQGFVEGVPEVNEEGVAELLEVVFHVGLNHVPWRRLASVTWIE